MIIAVIGSRDFTDYGKLKTILDRLKPTKIISGGASGADTLGERYADENKIQKVIYLPEWDKYGKGAGFVRNQLIIDDCEMVVALWDGKSRGTRNSIGIAHTQMKPIFIIY